MSKLERTRTTYVLVHGAWHGGWCWKRVRALLEAQGHRVLAPTLTGLGERAHLLGEDVGVQTHIDDLLAVLHCEEVDDCVLVGHSYAGIVIAGAMDRLFRLAAVPRVRVRHLVYLDAVVAAHGQCWSDMHSPAQRATRLASRQQLASGCSVLPAPLPVQLGIDAPQDQAWVASLLTPQPFRTYVEPLEAPSAAETAVPCTYIDCTAPSLPTLAKSKHHVRASGLWRIETLQAGHDCMVSAPEPTARALLAFA